jgi:hypothetical protein
MSQFEQLKVPEFIFLGEKFSYGIKCAKTISVEQAMNKYRHVATPATPSCKIRNRKKKNPRGANLRAGL